MQDELDTFGKRLQWAMDHSKPKIDKAGLARRLDITYQAVRKIINGTGAFGAENTFKAAHFLGVDPHWLATGNGLRKPLPTDVVITGDQASDDLFAFQQEKDEGLVHGELRHLVAAHYAAAQQAIRKPITLLNTGRIPLLNQGNTRMLDSYMDGTVTPTETYQYHDDKTTGLFAYIVPDDLMEPRIPRGCTAIIDINTEPRHGKHVLIQDGERSHIRRLIVDGDLKYQETVSGRLPARPLTGTIIGVVKEIVINLDDFDDVEMYIA